MNRRLVGMAAVVALLGGYLAYDHFGSQPPGGSEAVAPGAEVARPAAVKLNPLQDLDPETYTAIVERPLFNPSRQPRPPELVATPQPPVAEQPPPPPPPPPVPQGPGPEDYKLLGVASGPDGRIAALRVASNGEVVYLRKGESVDSWTVVDVGDRSVAIGTPDNPVTFSLFADAGGAGEGGTGQAQPDQPVENQGQPLPLPLPLPLPHPAQPPGMPEQHTVPDTGG